MKEVRYFEADLHLREIRFVQPAKDGPVLLSIHADVLKEVAVDELKGALKGAVNAILTQIRGWHRKEEGLDG